jgi:hypothetical protein
MTRASAPFAGRRSLTLRVGVITVAFVGCATDE